MTPGPWGVVPATEEAEAASVISKSDDDIWYGATIVEVECGDIEQTNSNAHLIAAAPDMLDALQYAYDRLGNSENEAWRRIAAAIKKARGTV